MSMSALSALSEAAEMRQSRARSVSRMAELWEVDCNQLALRGLPLQWMDSSGPLPNNEVRISFSIFVCSEFLLLLAFYYN